MTQQFQQAPEYGTAPRRPILPEQNLGWAAAALIFFWPLAFSAFGNASKVVPLWLSGDYEGAQQKSSRVKRLGQIALVVFLVLTVLFAVVYGMLFAAMVDSLETVQPTYPTYR